MPAERDLSPWRCRPANSAIEKISSSVEEHHVQLRLSIGPSETLITDNSSFGRENGEAQECTNNRFWNQAFRMGLADAKSGDLTVSGNGRFTVPVPKVPAKRPFNDSGSATDPLVSGSSSVSLTKWHDHSVAEEADNSTNPVAKMPSSVTENNRRVNSNCSAGHNPPVVGWPPVRSYRKQAIKSTPKHITDTSDGNCSSSGNPGIPPTEANPKPKPSTGLFVKVRLEGIRICRKIDLKSYQSYDALKLAMQELFQPFLKDNYGKLDLVHGTEYVVTHEDENGECFLVGDEPWHIFIASTVKGLRIMKATDATSIGEKAKSTT